jgi:hypothetical protein
MRAAAKQAGDFAPHLNLWTAADVGSLEGNLAGQTRNGVRGARSHDRDAALWVISFAAGELGQFMPLSAGTMPSRTAAYPSSESHRLQRW